MRVISALAILSLIGCAHGKMGKVEQGLEKGVITKTTPIFVNTVSAAKAEFTGDKSGKDEKVMKGKATIEKDYSRMIVEKLKSKGFNAQLAPKAIKEGVILDGQVTKVDNGSAAARYFVGMGAGSANLFTDFTLTDAKTKKSISKFEVIATSGGESGLGSYMDSHIKDGSEKVAEYLETATK